MPRRKRPDPKLAALREERTLNPRPQSVRDELFLGSAFFDARDLVQVKYEMLRRASEEGSSVSGASAAFGLSRPAFYKAKSAFEQAGLPGLLPRRPGPKRGHKLTSEIREFIEQSASADASLRARGLAGLVAERFGVRLHPRTIERALARGKRGAGDLLRTTTPDGRACRALRGVARPCRDVRRGAERVMESVRP